MTRLIACLIAAVCLTGCVERTLTIKTVPTDAIVTLNDEEIGNSPVTVAFNWYGDYNVVNRKEGFETLKTHRVLKGPWYDWFPFDMFAQLIVPKRIVDTYEWTFDLEKLKQPSREELIKSARTLQSQLK